MIDRIEEPFEEPFVLTEFSDSVRDYGQEMPRGEFSEATNRLYVQDRGHGINKLDAMFSAIYQEKE